MSNELRYKKDRSIDGHPICEDGRPLTKDEIISKLNEYEIFKSELVASVNPLFKAHIAGVMAVCENKVKRLRPIGE